MDDFTIQKESKEDGIVVFTTHFPDAEDGIAILHFHTARDFPDEERHELYRRGLSPEEIVCELTSFFPNGISDVFGSFVKPKESRFQGVGSAVLNEVIKEALLRKARGIYNEGASTQSARNFYEKKGFTRVDGILSRSDYFLQLCRN